ncbi:unnamed protein product, partial [Discosporangium mesarthrocarpum]
TACSWRQLPLDLCYAISTHKSHGLTIDKAIINLTASEKTLELTFVCMSRVMRIKDLEVLNFTLSLQRDFTERSGQTER